MIPFEHLANTPERVKTHIDREVERLLPDLKRLTRLFYEANWGDDTHDESPQVHFEIDLRTCPKHDGSQKNHVFSIQLYSDNSDEIDFILQVYAFSRHAWNVLAQATMKKEDWIK